ncbi:MAG: hypothetical protein ABJA37_11240 [Ferruginibacter sp.]
MPGLNEHISHINTKLQQLLRQYELLQNENIKQKQTIEVLQKQHHEFKNSLSDLQQQNLILKVSAAPLNEADKKELEQKINGYIRSIDKCISSLAQ